MLVTGGAGTLGRACFGALHDVGHEVIGTYWRRTADVTGIDMVPLDIRDRYHVEQVVDRIGPAAIIHPGTTLQSSSPSEMGWPRRCFGLDSVMRAASERAAP